MAGVTWRERHASLESGIIDHDLTNGCAKSTYAASGCTSSLNAMSNLCH